MHSIIILLALAIGVFGGGEVIILSQPASVEFRGHEPVDSDVVKDIGSMSYGFTTYTTSDWPGMYISDPFNFAEAVVAVAVDGVRSLDISEGHKFPFVPDSPMDDIGMFMESKIIDRFPFNESQTLVTLNMEEDVRAAELTLNRGSLQPKRPVVSFLREEEEDDSNFLSQIALWRAVLDKVEEKGIAVDGLPDMYWFNLRGLHPIMDLYGENSNTALEAKDLVLSTIERTKDVFDRAYQNKTLFMVLTCDSTHTRRFRRASDSELIQDLSLAAVYDENYPVMFNIFLWFTIAFIMTIIATSMVTACMDPGRDSIIYRMTSTRMKKDN